MGRIVSINVAQPRLVRWKGRDVSTAFLKRPVFGPVGFGSLTLEGDQQADARYHGGPDQAVYVYAHEHYPEWTRRLGVLDLPPGSFGENLTIEGYDDHDVRIGDKFRAGTAVLQVTKPREPCYKMNVRFNRDDAVKLFANAELPGFYCRVLTTGTAEAGDAFDRIENALDQPGLVDDFRRRLHRR